MSAEFERIADMNNHIVHHEIIEQYMRLQHSFLYMIRTLHQVLYLGAQLGMKSLNTDT